MGEVIWGVDFAGQKRGRVPSHELLPPLDFPVAREQRALDPNDAFLFVNPDGTQTVEFKS